MFEESCTPGSLSDFAAPASTSLTAMGDLSDFSSFHNDSESTILTTTMGDLSDFVLPQSDSNVIARFSLSPLQSDSDATTTTPNTCSMNTEWEVAGAKIAREQACTTRLKHIGCEGRAAKRRRYTATATAYWLARFDGKWMELEELGEQKLSTAHVARAVLCIEPTDTKRVIQSALERWVKRRRDMDVVLFYNSFKSPGRKSWFPDAEAILMEMFRQRRRRGLSITELWMVVTFRRLVRGLDLGHEPISQGRRDKLLSSHDRPTHGWVRRFVLRNKLVPRRKTNTKSKPLTDRLIMIQNHLRRLRGEFLSPCAGLPLQCPRYGRFRLQNRFNVDQVPLPFVVSMNTTWEEKGTHRVWIKHTGSGLDKRQASLQICVRAEGKQCISIALIFRGSADTDHYDKSIKGRRPERERYDPRIRKHVYFQKSAWADPNFTKEWVNRTLIPGIAEEGIVDEWLIFADNLGGQAAADGDFKEACHDANGLVCNYPPGCTDEVQVVDAGIGQMVVEQIGVQQMKWLDATVDGHANIDLWDTAGALDSSDRRVLMTIWTAEAQEIVFAKTEMIERAWERTGSALTYNDGIVDVEYDKKIRLEGYEVLQDQHGPFHFMDVELQPRLPSRAYRNSNEAGTKSYGIDLSHETYQAGIDNIAHPGSTRPLMLEMQNTLDYQNLKELLSLLPNIVIDTDTPLSEDYRTNPSTSMVFKLDEREGWVMATFYHRPVLTQRQRGFTHRVRHNSKTHALTLKPENRCYDAATGDHDGMQWALVKSTMTIAIVVPSTTTPATISIAASTSTIATISVVAM